MINNMVIKRVHLELENAVLNTLWFKEEMLIEIREYFKPNGNKKNTVNQNV